MAGKNFSTIFVIVEKQNFASVHNIKDIIVETLRATS